MKQYLLTISPYHCTCTNPDAFKTDEYGLYHRLMDSESPAGIIAEAEKFATFFDGHVDISIAEYIPSKIAPKYIEIFENEIVYMDIILKTLGEWRTSAQAWMTEDYTFVMYNEIEKTFRCDY